MCSLSRKARPLKVRVMSKAPSPYLQLRSRNGISTRFSGMNLPLNQARRELVSCVIVVSAILAVQDQPAVRPWGNAGPPVVGENSYARDRSWYVGQHPAERMGLRDGTDIDG